MKECRVCRAPQSFSNFAKSARFTDGLDTRCRSCSKLYQAQWRAEHRDSLREQQRRWRASDLARSRELQANFRARHRERLAISSPIKARRLRLALRWQVLMAYSNGQPICTCCSETTLEFLTIDHIDGGGNAHRRAIGGGGGAFYTWLRANNFPPGFQVLCHNCNWAKGHYDACPHHTAPHHL